MQQAQLLHTSVAFGAKQINQVWVTFSEEFYIHQQITFLLTLLKDYNFLWLSKIKQNFISLPKLYIEILSTYYKEKAEKRFSWIFFSPLNPNDSRHEKDRQTDKRTNGQTDIDRYKRTTAFGFDFFLFKIPKHWKMMICILK